MFLEPEESLEAIVGHQVEVSFCLCCVKPAHVIGIETSRDYFQDGRRSVVLHQDYLVLVDADAAVVQESRLRGCLRELASNPAG